MNNQLEAILLLALDINDAKIYMEDNPDDPFAEHEVEMCEEAFEWAVINYGRND